MVKLDVKVQKLNPLDPSGIGGISAKNLYFVYSNSNCNNIIRFFIFLAVTNKQIAIGSKISFCSIVGLKLFVFIEPEEIRIKKISQIDRLLIKINNKAK